MKTITLTQGNAGEFSAYNNNTKEQVIYGLLPKITEDTVFNLFREGNRKETVFTHPDNENLRIDSQTHPKEFFNIQVQLDTVSLAGAHIAAELSDTDDSDGPNYPRKLAGKIRNALQSSLEDGHFWQVYAEGSPAPQASAT